MVSGRGRAISDDRPYRDHVAVRHLSKSRNAEVGALGKLKVVFRRAAYDDNKSNVGYDFHGDAPNSPDRL